jgi:hypothetical protein
MGFLWEKWFENIQESRGVGTHVFLLKKINSQISVEIIEIEESWIFMFFFFFFLKRFFKKAKELGIQEQHDIKFGK